MPTLYPSIEPFSTDFLEVSTTHRIYYEQSGRPDGWPVLFVHGGPGSNVSATHRRFFDPEHYRIILFDQRGCGKSTPSGCLVENTTWHLVSDIARLLDYLSIPKVVLFGGSWGSTLSLAFAIEHPRRVAAMILRGIFLVSPRELRWFYQDGASHIFPEEFERYRSAVNAEEHDDLLLAYYRTLHADNPTEALAAARAWCRWEAAASFLEHREDYLKKFDDDALTMAFARIESHYFHHAAFFATPYQLLESLERIQEIPGVIVQGRYDLVCPMETAWRLHRAWPRARLHIVARGGHSALDDEVTQALVQATDEFRTLPV